VTFSLTMVGKPTLYVPVFDHRCLTQPEVRLAHACSTASKHGVIGLMRTLANELGPDGITVNAICPGWVRTPMLGASLEDAGADPADLSAFTGMSTIERLVESEEVTDAVVFLTSPGARMITGTALPIDGGLMEKRAWP
jgi:NAD(P)-dependent dehydrogenase (short-subunit alcohol dehydrogenase family)